MTNTQQRARRELGHFLRSMRDRATPPTAPDVGGRRSRRAPGMRREEVAYAAGISTTWYTWLEQGRPFGVSSRTLQAIAAALQLASAEQLHLRRLAVVATGDTCDVAQRCTEPSAANAILLGALQPHPAWLVNGWWDVLLANDAASTVLGAAAVAGATDNFMRRLLVDEGWRQRFVSWESVAESVVAQFRRATASCVGEPRWEAFVEAMAASSREFRTLWARHDVATVDERLVELVDGDGERRAYHMEVLTADPMPSGLRVLVFLPVDGAPSLAVGSGDGRR